MTDITIHDHVRWWLMTHNTDADVRLAMHNPELNRIEQLHALADSVITNPDKNKLHRRIYAGAVADRLGS